MEENQVNNVERIKPTKKEHIISAIVAFVTCSLICVGVILIDVFVKELNFKDNGLTIFGDGFFVAGVLCVLFWLLVVVSQAGAFDMLVYGCRKFFIYIFRKHPEDSNLPATYYDYVMLKHKNKPKRFYWSLVVSLVYLTIGIILSLITLSE